MTDPQDVLDDAVRHHAHTEDPGAITTAWVVLYATTVPGHPDATATAYVVSDGMAHYAALGLIETIRHYVRRELNDAEENE